MVGPPTDGRSLYARLPLAFEAEGGGTGSGARFLSRGVDHSLVLTAEGAALTLRGARPAARAPGICPASEPAAATLRMRLAGTVTRR